MCLTAELAEPAEIIFISGENVGHKLHNHNDKEPKLFPILRSKKWPLKSSKSLSFDQIKTKLTFQKETTESSSKTKTEEEVKTEVSTSAMSHSSVSS